MRHVRGLRNQSGFIECLYEDITRLDAIDDQAKLVARYLKGLQEKSSHTLGFKQLKDRNDEAWRGGRRYLNSPRHRLEVEHFSYRRELQRRAKEIGHR